MLRKLGLILVALALFSIAGGHWGVLQTVAWAEMLRDYSQRTGSVTVALGQTFDGQHPCDLCREIQTAKSREHGGNPITPVTKDDAKVKALVADSSLLPLERTAEEISFPAPLFSTAPAAPNSRRPRRLGGRTSRPSAPLG